MTDHSEATTRSGAHVEPVEFDIAAAVNDRAVLDFCLMRSEAISSGQARLRTYEGFATAGLAYNQALDDSKAPYLVLVHQDVYLPRTFTARVRAEIATLNQVDPNWAVAGSIGMDAAGQVHGRTWSSGLRKLVGSKAEAPASVDTLDEVLLIVRRGTGVRFDPDLPSFHLYAADIVQVARAGGRASYVIDAPVIHHSRPAVDLRGGYQKAYSYMRRKWRPVLPLPNLVCPIYPTMIPFWMRSARMLWQARGNTVRRDPEGDPVDIARQLGLD